MAKVLVVDDIDVNRALLVTVLKFRGDQYLEAGNGLEALAVLNSEPVDLVITDITMPRMDGYELARRMREEPALKHIPFVFYTASYRESEARKRARSYGAAEVLIKPADPQTILGLLSALLPDAAPAAVVSQPAILLASPQPVNTRLSAFVDLFIELGSLDSPPALVKTVCEMLPFIIPGEAAAVRLNRGDSDADCFYWEYWQTQTQALSPKFKFPSGFAHNVMSDLKPVCVNGPAASNLGIEASERNVSSCLIAPVCRGQRVYGWVLVCNALAAGGFNEPDLRIAQTVASQLAVCYENLLNQESERKLALSIFENSAAAFFVLDEEFKVRTANSAVREKLDLGAERCVGLPLWELLSADLPWDQVRQKLRNGEGIELESCPFLLDDGRRYFDISFWPVRGLVSLSNRYVARLVDVSPRIQLQKVRDDFVAALTHDLKTPLVGADRTLEMLLEGSFGNLEKSGRDVLTLLRESNKNMLDMVQNLLVTYKLQSGAALFLQVIDLKALVVSVANELAILAERAGVNVQVEVDETIEPILADRSALRRLLINLLGNAIKFTPAAGLIKIVGRRNGQEVVLEVSDTGPGIAPEIQSRLFERYQYTDDHDKYSVGSGLGLYVSRQIAEAHKGRISCQSHPEKGSIFRVTLPGESRSEPIAERTPKRLI